ncbi:hypothetical protein N7G274_006622 [Stereocaulon virgatum]|uniref:Uncharacterized protein n=1 Tax=Stereocaulon virgatum TaxID=373712 RepID=A0ABR4ABD2_9LECA
MASAKADIRDLKALFKANKCENGRHHCSQKLSIVMSESSVDQLLKDLCDSTLALREFVDDNEDFHQIQRCNEMQEDYQLLVCDPEAFKRPIPGDNLRMESQLLREVRGHAASRVPMPHKSVCLTDNIKRRPGWHRVHLVVPDSPLHRHLHLNTLYLQG